MKQILSLALALLPCLAWAQYPSNGNQKITLGEQTSADGLVFRGYATTDTVAATSKITRTNKQDTSVYLLLDTVTNLLWHYKIGSNGWSQAGGSTFDTTSIKYVNTYGTQTVNGAKTISGVTIFSNTTEAGNAASAPVTFLGGVGIAKNLRVGGSIVADGPDKSIATLNGGDMQFYNTGNNQFGRILSTAGSGGNIRFQANGSTNLLDLGSTGLVTIFNLAGGTSNRPVLADVNGSLSAPSTPLPVANGGTNTSTAFTAGSVVFAGASGTYTQDNSGLFYDNTNDRLGIVTSTPSYKLHIKPTSSGRTTHDSRMLMTIESNSEAYYSVNVPSTGYGGFRVHTTPAEAATAVFEYWAPNKKFYFLTGGFYEFNDKNNNKLLTIDSTGFIGINQVTPSERLHVVGNARITAVGAGAYSNDLNITSTGVLTTASSSDETFKYNINPIAYGLSTILQLKPVSFQWKKGDEHDLGFIAQDAVNIIPEAVDTFWDSSLLFRSNTIIPILTKAIQEQNALIKALEQRIINLENK